VRGLITGACRTRHAFARCEPHAAVRDSRCASPAATCAFGAAGAQSTHCASCSCCFLVRATAALPGRLQRAPGRLQRRPPGRLGDRDVLTARAARTRSILREVPFDPHLEHLFNGEEILYSARAWTHGAPPPPMRPPPPPPTPHPPQNPTCARAPLPGAPRLFQANTPVCWRLSTQAPRHTGPPLRRSCCRRPGLAARRLASPMRCRAAARAQAWGYEGFDVCSPFPMQALTSSRPARTRAGTCT
jgi:hypothetical protein